MAGACYGGRLTIELAALDRQVAGVALVVPHLRSAEAARGKRETVSTSTSPIDDDVVAAVSTILRHAPIWSVAEEKDSDESCVVCRQPS
jgi:dienelactone hydrolase